MRIPYVALNVSPNGGRTRPGAQDIVASVRSEVERGRLPAGSRLPPVRSLERSLGISKNTVKAAYDELCEQGLCETRAREGVFVAKRFSQRIDATSRRSPSPVRARPTPVPIGGWPSHGRLPLSMVFIDPELLPRERLTECYRSVLARPLKPYYDAQGHPPLREAIATRLRRRGIDTTADEVVITTGSQHALDIVARSIAGDGIAHENPVYGHARMLYASLGKRTIPLPLDPFVGPDLEAWSRTLAKTKPSLLYAITSYQNPTGYSYTTSELIRLLELSAEHGFGLLEDDWGSDMRTGTEHRPTLRALGGENVVYVNSFTKKLLPALRLGYVVASKALVPTLTFHKRLAILANAQLSEAVLAEFLERGYYDVHLTRLQAALDARYHRTLEVLRATMPEEVRFTTPGGGPTLWLDLPRTIDLPTLRKNLAAKGVDIEDASAQFEGPALLHGFRVSYAFLPEADLERALGILATEVTRLCAAMRHVAPVPTQRVARAR
jgi:2-aminoadipate transaminase